MNRTKNVVRRLAAILVADLVGYTEHMRADETATHNRVQSDLNTLFLPKIREHNGRVVKTMGDGILAEFASAVDCLECAIEIQPAITAKQADMPNDSHFLYRMALNVGDIIVEHDDIYGDGVNIAMRLQVIGEPGGIVLSEDAYRQVHGKTSVQFEDFGDHFVKGVTEPIRVHRIQLAGAKPTNLRDSNGGLISQFPAAPSIAVLPFDNLSGDPGRSYFSDGITNDIITDLSKFSQLFVLASHTVFAYKNRVGKLQSICRELGVRYVVEGSVQSAADRVRINVQLVEGDNGRHLWAQRYDRPLSEVFQLQEEIVQTVVGTLVGRIHQSEHQRVLRSKPDSLEAYDAYLRGRAEFSNWTKKSNMLAHSYFRQALNLDPAFALAFGYLSYTLVQAWLGGWDQSPDTPRQACELAKKAVELDPAEFDNHWSLAAAYLVCRDYDKSISAYERAAALNPNCPNLLVDMAECLVYIGRPDEAIANINRAMQLNPMYPDWYLWTLGIALYHTGEYEKSVAALTKGNPPNLAHRLLIAAYVRLGRMDSARRTVLEFLDSDPTYTLSREQGWPYRDPTVLGALVEDLRSAGLPEKTVAPPTKARVTK